MISLSDVEGKTTDWTSVSAVTLGITTFATAMGLTYPLLSFLLANRNVSESLIGVHAATFMLGLAVSVALLPFLNRFMRAGFLIVGGLVFSSFALIVFSLIDNLWAWLILRFILGFCVNIVYVLGEAWLNAAAADSIRGRVAGLFSAGMALGFILGPLGIPLFGTEGGLAFAVCASIVALVAFLFAFISQHAKVEPERIVLSEVLTFFSHAPFLILLIVIFGIMDSAAITFLPLYLVSEGLSQSAGAIYITVMHIGMVVSQPFLGWSLDRFNRWNVAIACLLATALSFLVLMNVPVDSLLIWPASAFIGAAFFAVYTSALTLLGQDFSGSLLVAGSAAMALAYSLGGVVGPITAGVLFQQSPPKAFILLMIINLIGVAFIVSNRRKQNPYPPRETLL